MRKAGADSVRLQIAQAGAAPDPQNKLFDREFLEKAMGAIRAARAAGLTVIVCVQYESHVPKDKFIDLPDAGTQRVWKEIAPQFANDRGVLFELFNEPRPAPNPQNWKRWKTAMTETIRTVRETGARNVVIARCRFLGRNCRIRCPKICICDRALAIDRRQGFPQFACCGFVSCANVNANNFTCVCIESQPNPLLETDMLKFLLFTIKLLVLRFKGKWTNRD